MKINAVRPDFAISLVNKGDSGIHPVSSGIFIRKLKQNIMQTLTYNKATKQVTLYNSIAANKEHKIETFNNIASINLSNERIWGYNDLNAIVFSVTRKNQRDLFVMKKNYTEGLSIGQKFFVFWYRIFYRRQYLDFKQDIDNGMRPIYSYEWNI